jgi:hypothetical protein
MEKKVKSVDLRPIHFMREPPPRDKVGRCRFDQPTNKIMIKVHEGYEYEVDLDRCQTSGAVLDWVHQVHEKNWGRAIIADFLEILFDYIDTELWAWKN